MKIANSEKKKVEQLLRKCLIVENKFVKAWAYNRLCTLSKQHSEYGEETKQFLEVAMKDEEPSVKAKIRNIMKKATNNQSMDLVWFGLFSTAVNCLLASAPDLINPLPLL